MSVSIVKLLNFKTQGGQMKGRKRRPVYICTGVAVHDGVIDPDASTEPDFVLLEKLLITFFQLPSDNEICWNTLLLVRETY